MEKKYIEFGRRLRRVRHTLGYTQEYMSECLGMSERHYRRYEDIVNIHL